MWRTPSRRSRPKGSVGFEVYPVGLDDGVGEKPLAHPLDLGLRGGRICFGELDLKILALPDALDAFEAKAVKGQLDGLALGIEHALFQGHVNDGAHQLLRGRFVEGERGAQVARSNLR